MISPMPWTPRLWVSNAALYRPFNLRWRGRRFLTLLTVSERRSPTFHAWAHLTWQPYPGYAPYPLHSIPPVPHPIPVSHFPSLPLNVTIGLGANGVGRSYRGLAVPIIRPAPSKLPVSLDVRPTLRQYCKRKQGIWRTLRPFLVRLLRPLLFKETK